MRSLVVAFEGPDGVGKTTQIKEVAKYLSAQGINVYYQKMPFNFAKEVFNKDVGEDARVVLLFKDYEMVSHDFSHKVYSDDNNNEYNILLLDRIPHISAYAYNQRYCSFNIDDMLGDSIWDYYKTPDLAVIFNRMPYRAPDETLFEERNNPAEIFRFYDEYESAPSDYNQVKIIKVFGENGLLDNNAEVSYITEKLTELVYNEVMLLFKKYGT